MTSRTMLLLLAAAGLAACANGGPDDQTGPPPPPGAPSPPPPPAASPCAADTTHGAPVPKVAGSWTGSGTFTQTWSGKTATVPVKLNLEFDGEGVPKTLPALGMITPWHADPFQGPSLREQFERGGTAYAYCTMEADGSANLINIAPASRCGSESAVAWRYRATYQFADLLAYNLYDYAQPGAPEVKVDATDSFSLGTANGLETLTVRAHAQGATTDGQKPVELRVDAQLTRGQGVYGNTCRLGHELQP